MKCFRSMTLNRECGMIYSTELAGCKANKVQVWGTVRGENIVMPSD